MKSTAPAVVLSLVVFFLSVPAVPEDLSSPSPASSPAPVPARVRVEVLSQLGKPIPGGRVVLYRQPGPEETDIGPCGRWEEIAPAVVSPGIYAGEVAPGTYRIEVTGEEWIGVVEEKAEIPPGETGEFKFNLEPGSVLAGWVRDEAGNPLPDVEVVYYLEESEPGAWLFSRVSRAATDTAGWFAFRNLSPGVYNLKFSRPGYIPAEVNDTATGTSDLEVILKPGFTIRGRLEGDLEGLQSPVRLKLESRRGSGRRTLSRSVELGPDHTFEINDLHPGIYALCLQDKDRLSDWVREVAALPSEEAAPITLNVFRGATLSGRVSAAGTGAPLSGVSLNLFPAGSKNRKSVSSDGRGEFSFRGLEGGEYTLKARLWQDPYAKVRLEKQVVIEPGREIAGFDLELEAGREITFSGAVFSENGGPVGEADLRIKFRSPGEKSYKENFRARAASDSSGDFALPAYLESGDEGEVLITANQKGYAQAEKKIEISPGQTSVGGIVLVLDAGLTLEVEVGGGEDGRSPVPSAVVTLSTDWSPEREFRNFVRLKKLADGRGRCRFENLSPDAYELEVAKPGYGPVKEKVTLTESETIKTVRPVLKEGRTLLVRVIDETGEGVAGAAISAREKTAGFEFVMGGMPGENLTAGGGICLLRDLPAAPLHLSVRADGYVDIRRHPVGVEEDEVSLVLKAAGSLRGRFLGAGGRPAADLNIITVKRDADLFDFGSASSRTRDLGGGVFRVDNLAPAVYDLKIRSPGLAARKIEAVEVEAGRETDLGEIVLGPGSSISGRVRKEEDGSPLKGAVVRVETAAETMASLSIGSSRTDAEGSFTLDGLNASTVTLVASARDYRPERIVGITVGIGEEKKIPDIYLARMTEAEKEESARRKHIIPSLGVRIAERGMREGTGSPLPLVIEEVLPGTAAAAGGLAAGDEIVKINGKSFVEEPLEFMRGLMAPPGTEIRITVRKAGDGREEELGLTVDQWNVEDLLRQATPTD